MNLSLTSYIILAVLAAINIFAFFIMMADKFQSTHAGASRISEGMMFFLGVIGGSLGVYLGMFVFRHKTRKWHFLIGFPFLAAQNAAAAYCLLIFLS